MTCGLKVLTENKISYFSNRGYHMQYVFIRALKTDVSKKFERYQRDKNELADF